MSEHISTGEEEVERERGMLLEVLEQLPAVLTVDELIRARATDPSDAVEAETQARAIHELCRYGLLRREGESVFPTMAAIRTYQLFELR